VSTVSELFPAGGGDNTIDMVASGTLANGQTVILQSDGTVKAVGESSTSVSENLSLGIEPVNSDTDSVFNAFTPVIDFDPFNANKFIIAYRAQDTGGDWDDLYIQVGTISGGTITFGSHINALAIYTQYHNIKFDPSTENSFAIFYQNNGGTGNRKAQVMAGTVSGTTVTVGTGVTITGSTQYTADHSMEFNPNVAGQLIATYLNYDASLYGQAVVCTISGTTVTAGSIQTWSTQAYGTIIRFDPNTANKFIIGYRHGGNDDFKVRVCTISNGTITFGAEYAPHSGVSYAHGFDYLSADKFVATYGTSGWSGIPNIRVGTISGTAITWGTEIAATTGGDATYSALKCDANTPNKFLLCFKDNSNSSYLTAKVGSVSGTTITLGSETVLYSGMPVTFKQSMISIDSYNAGKFGVVVAQSDAGSTKLIRVGLCQIAATTTTTNLTSTNLLGVAQDSAVDGATVSIETLGGLSAVHSGLTIGSDYYVEDDGTLTTTATDNVSLGKAVSATTINMRDYV